ncbi:Uncharacterized conserved protein YjiS, DUF1127 family [Loktanella sp. DSM 29012]|uniref:DUF1127 domain-containing protein n=1 Tax=Loktanella gaetbuli TaxID=2881335 RepID=A0ABS8BWU5_9RHOB|nr:MULTISPECIES: DUF1127 domain-containing protein [Loktanella]MCB5200208.1 DUF1127 domain-containing protein [Loktanella gaetbuli]SEP82081.1 Uncharacterized conserved protein YjiS, DUF1127 family [Loktanella sp. DSM 29012]
MAVISNSRTFNLPRSLRFAGTLFSAIVAWNDARVTRKALSGLTARELDDLGLTRADIDAVARGTYR